MRLHPAHMGKMKNAYVVLEETSWETGDVRIILK
jgi:hypothetical protein